MKKILFLFLFFPLVSFASFPIKNDTIKKEISSEVDNFEDGYDLAYELISSGKALEKFDEFINFKS